MLKQLFILTTAVVLALPGATTAQNPPADPNMVYIPVAVTGAKNAYIPGLQKDNFKLLEDNIQQNVSYFSQEDQPFDIDIILALGALQRGRADLNSSKIREAVETFRQSGNPKNKYEIEEMPFGANGIFDAMSRHVTHLSSTSTNPRKLLLVITDGFEASGGDPGRALQEYAKKKDVPIHLVFAAQQGPAGDGPDLATVTRGGAIHLEGGAIYEDLTKFTGGRLYQAEADTQLRAALQNLAQEMKAQYILGFKSTNDARNDKWRKIEVKITPPAGQKDLKPKVRDRYFVAKVK